MNLGYFLIGGKELIPQDIKIYLRDKLNGFVLKKSIQNFKGGHHLKRERLCNRDCFSSLSKKKLVKCYEIINIYLFRCSCQHK